MKPLAIREELITGSSEDLNRRRKIIALSALGLADFIIISLYQTGIIKKLPDLPGKVLIPTFRACRSGGNRIPSPRLTEAKFIIKKVDDLHIAKLITSSWI